ncbi:MAG: hypothetical protein ABWY27_10430 [Telluria sp.]
MNIKDAIIRVFALALSLGVLMAMTCSEQFQQAARAESGSFDALAHDLFNGSDVASARGKQAAR